MKIYKISIAMLIWIIQVFFLFKFLPNILDLVNGEFSVGRADSNDYVFGGDIPNKLLSQMSKLHFKIVKDTNDVDNPAYIEVNHFYKTPLIYQINNIIFH